MKVVAREVRVGDRIMFRGEFRQVVAIHPSEVGWWVIRLRPRAKGGDPQIIRKLALSPVEVEGGQARTRYGLDHQRAAQAASRKAAEKRLAKKQAAVEASPFDWDEAPGGLQAAAFPELRAPRPVAKPGVQMALMRRRHRYHRHPSHPYLHPATRRHRKRR